MAEIKSAIKITDYTAGFGIKTRIAARVVSTSNVNLLVDLVGTVVDGITLVATDRILLIGQTTGTQNGVYEVVAGAGNTVRAPDFELGDDIAQVFISVNEGTNYANTEWQATSGTVIGSGSLGFKQKNKFNYVAGDFIYPNSTNTLTTLAKPSINSYLQMGSSGVPSWSSSANSSAYFICKWGTTATFAGTYNASGGAQGTGAFTAVNLTSASFDNGGGTLAIGEKILVKNQTDAKQNGIYIITVAGVSGAIERTEENTGLPGQTVNITRGTSLINTFWILQGSAPLILNTDNLTYVQNFVAGNGITFSNTSILANLFTNGGLVFNSGAIQVNLSATTMAGNLPVLFGGTGLNSIASGNIMIGNAGGPVTVFPPVSRKVLISNSGPTFTLSNTINLSQINGASDDLALLAFSPVASAVNNFQITNAITTGAPIFSSIGSDTNIGMNFQTKGTGSYELLGTSTSSAQLNYYIQTTNGSKFIGLKAPTNITSSVAFTLPIADGTSGQALITNGSGQLSFSSNFAINLVLNPNNITIGGGSFTPVAYLAYTTARYGTSVSASLIFESVVTAATFNIRVFNRTTSTTLVSQSITSSAFNTISFTTPAANARISIDVQKTGSGTNARIFGIQMGIL